MAACIDFAILLFILADMFQWMTAQFYARVNPEVFEQLHQLQNISEIWALFWHSKFGEMWLLNGVIQLVFVGALMLCAQSLWGGTPGKKLLGLQIVRVKTLEPISLPRFAFRLLAYIPSILPLMIGFFLINFNKQRRGWHDRMAGTVVIHTRPRGWVWRAIKQGIRYLWRWLRQAMHRS